MNKTLTKLSCVLLPALLSLSACSSPEPTATAQLRFNESVLPLGDGFLASNFGSAALTPKSDERKG